MAHRNLNLLTIIVATHGTENHGITLAEIIEKADGHLKRSTVHRLLRTYPGFKIARYPTYPRSYYFDAGASGKDLHLDTKQVLDAKKPYKIKTKFGWVENPRPYSYPSLEQLVLNLSDTDNMRKALSDSAGVIKWIRKQVSTGDLVTPLVKEEKDENLAKMIRARSMAYFIYMAYEQLLTDPTLQGTEWFKPFDQKVVD